MWKKKGEVVYLWCDLGTKNQKTPENTVFVCHGKHTQWKESLLFTSGNSKHFFVCVKAQLENVWLLKTDLKRLFGAIMFNIEDKCGLQNYRNIVRESKKSTNRWSFDQDVGLNTEWYYRFMVLLI